MLRSVLRNARRSVPAYVDAAYSTGTIIPEREAGTRMLEARADYC